MRSKALGKVPMMWASTPHGMLAVAEDPPYELRLLEESDVVADHIIATVDLTDLEEGPANEIIRNILQGGYLEKPGVKDKGDAVLFMLVNEAIQVLESAAGEL
ncbi:MAG: hypothetical protein V1792_19315 [Pseudomonadota bacterium]